MQRRYHAESKNQPMRKRYRASGDDKQVAQNTGTEKDLAYKGDRNSGADLLQGHASTGAAAGYSVPRDLRYAPDPARREREGYLMDRITIMIFVFAFLLVVAVAKAIQLIAIEIIEDLTERRRAWRRRRRRGSRRGYTRARSTGTWHGPH